jgi:hypothetical protein
MVSCKEGEGAILTSQFLGVCLGGTGRILYTQGLKGFPAPRTEEKNPELLSTAHSTGSPW